MINVAEKNKLIDNLFEKYGLSAECYGIVPDIRAWCQSQGIAEDNPQRQAKCLCRTSDGAYYVLFRETINDEMITSSKDAMTLRGLGGKVSLLVDDDMYFEHLVLHEIACVVLGDTSQCWRDEWAFEEMGL